MGKLEKQVLGKIRGKVGDVFFRITNGQAIVSACPTKRELSNDPAAIKRRTQFGIAVKLSHAINYLSQLKHFWKAFNSGSEDAHRSAFNKIVKENYSRVSDTDVLATASLVPELGFEISASDITLSNSAISVELDPIGPDKGIDTQVETHYQLACVLFLKSPVLETEKPVYFMHRISTKAVLNLVNSLTVNFSLDNIEKQLFDAYTVRKGLFTLITLNADNVPVRYSNTFQSV